MVTSATMERPALPADRRLRGLYAITADRDDCGLLLEEVAAAIDGGASVIQYRNKSADPAGRHRQAVALRMLCGARGVPLIVNDDWRLALEVDADGVHLGGDDGALVEARAALGPQRLLGASCYASLERALDARAVADQVAFGAVFTSDTKPGAVRAPLALLGQARAAGCNVVAIGGITAHNVAQVMTAGADAVAVIGAVFGAGAPGDIERATARLVQAMQGGPID